MSVLGMIHGAEIIPLKAQFLKIYRFSVNKLASVYDHARWREEFPWNFNFISKAQDWGLEEFFKFFDTI